MKMNDIRDILNKRQHAIFLATPLRDPAVRGGRVVITSISDTGKIKTRRVTSEGTLGSVWHASPRDFRGVTDEDHTPEEPTTDNG
jgi:hypothetical protein